MIPDEWVIGYMDGWSGPSLFQKEQGSRDGSLTWVKGNALRAACYVEDDRSPMSAGCERLRQSDSSRRPRNLTSEFGVRCGMGNVAAGRDVPRSVEADNTWSKQIKVARWFRIGEGLQCPESGSAAFR